MKKITTFLIVLALIGCSHKNRSFPPVTQTITVEVSIVGSRSYFEYEPYKNPYKGVMGYMTGPPYKIFVLGYEKDGHVYPESDYYLGHELSEALHNANPRFGWPHYR